MRYLFSKLAKLDFFLLIREWLGDGMVREKNSGNVEEKQGERASGVLRRLPKSTSEFSRDFGSLTLQPSEASQGLRFCRAENSFLPSLVVKAPVSFLHKHAPNGRVRLMGHPKESDERQEKDGIRNENKKYNEHGCHRLSSEVFEHFRSDPCRMPNGSWGATLHIRRSWPGARIGDIFQLAAVVNCCGDRR